jgi:hypothetical protein
MAMSHRQPNLFRTLLSLFKGEPHELPWPVQSQHAMLARFITMVMPEVRLCFCGLFSRGSVKRLVSKSESGRVGRSECEDWLGSSIHQEILFIDFLENVEHCLFS